MTAIKSTIKKNNSKHISVLLIGNNPIELSSLYDQFISMKEKISHVYVSFNEREAMRSISLNQPNCIIIDDNYGESSMKKLINSLKKFKRASFYLTLIKSSNNAFSILGFQDYFMKEGLTAERILNSINNSFKLGRRHLRPVK